MSAKRNGNKEAQFLLIERLAAPESGVSRGDGSKTPRGLSKVVHF